MITANDVLQEAQIERDCRLMFEIKLGQIKNGPAIKEKIQLSLGDLVNGYFRVGRKAPGEENPLEPPARIARIDRGNITVMPLLFLNRK